MYQNVFSDLPRNKKKPLDWNTRMKIAAGAAKGLKYLHEISNPLAVHGNIKPSNILIGEGYEPKLSDFLVLKECIPEHDESSYASFGLVLLELISGRIAEMEPSLVEWGKHKLVFGKEFTAVADPLLNCHYPEQGLYQALSLAAECLQLEDASRPRIGHVVNVLSNLASEIYDPNAIQINRAGTLAIGSDEKEKLGELWQHVCLFGLQEFLHDQIPDRNCMFGIQKDLACRVS
ncbi:receptor-like cytoplasmic kinase 185 [Papaver somniferum]|uniref:receptor-like cytoplasmic kinase 185 n=1 Tax=Papaver somniferum TaxID=3469 RepID=UPI000E70274A|nr:receptor-like cytoplasmic kinase 185 [Papaver somniferum]